MFLVLKMLFCLFLSQDNIVISKMFSTSKGDNARLKFSLFCRNNNEKKNVLPAIYFPNQTLFIIFSLYFLKRIILICTKFGQKHLPKNAFSKLRSCCMLPSLALFLRCLLLYLLFFFVLIVLLSSLICAL